jgi:nuclease S1
LIQRLLSVFVTCCLLFASPAYPWWETGHQVIARIAAAHLTPAARTRVARILGVPDTPQAVADALAQSSTWADETKAETKSGNWHFIDLTLQDGKSDIPARCPDDNCAPARIRLFALQLKSRVPSPEWSQLDALRYVVHLVADVHQPLHDISNADLGGNCELFNPALPGDIKNLHALWDGGIVGAMDVSAQSLTDSLEAEVKEMSEPDQQQLAAGNQDDWVWEGHELAIAHIYHKLHIPVQPVIFPKSCADAPAAITSFEPPADPAYITAMKPVVRLQLSRAGLRLARLLNESL